MVTVPLAVPVVINGVNITTETHVFSSRIPAFDDLELPHDEDAYRKNLRESLERLFREQADEFAKAAKKASEENIFKRAVDSVAETWNSLWK